MPNIVAQSVDAPAYTWQQVQALPPSQKRDVLGDSMEVMMDVQIIAGLCTGANITVYFSSFDQQGWVDLLSAVLAGTTGDPLMQLGDWRKKTLGMVFQCCRRH